MMDRLVWLVLIGVVLGAATADPKLQCTKQDSCSCRISDHEKIDISNLLPTGVSYLEDTYQNHTYVFFGCKDVDLDTKNSTSYIPVLRPVHGSLFLLDRSVPANETTLKPVGWANQTTYDLVSNNYELHYKNDTFIYTLVLVCADQDTPFLKILSKEGSPTLALVSPHACVLKEPHGYSTGSILVIIFIVASILYFFGGALMLYFIRGARGIELVPNIDFWKSLPGLIKDGLVFLLSGCRTSNIETYNRI